MSTSIEKPKKHLPDTHPAAANNGKREAVLNTATNLFSKNGYHRVGIDRIIEESGVAKMTMYRYFPSKHHLIAEMMKEHARTCTQSLVDFTAGIDNPEIRLKAVFRWHDQRFRNPSFTGCMFAHAAFEFSEKNSEIHQVSVEQKRQLTAFLRDILKQMMGTRQANELARIYVMLLDGATLTAQICGRLVAATEAWEAARKMLALARAEDRPS